MDKKQAFELAKKALSNSWDEYIDYGIFCMVCVLLDMPLTEVKALENEYFEEVKNNE